jgi:hypothetical protein
MLAAVSVVSRWGWYIVYKETLLVDKTKKRRKKHTWGPHDVNKHRLGPHRALIPFVPPPRRDVTFSCPPLHPTPYPPNERWLTPSSSFHAPSTPRAVAREARGVWCIIRHGVVVVVVVVCHLIPPSLPSPTGPCASAPMIHPASSCSQARGWVLDEPRTHVVGGFGA